MQPFAYAIRTSINTSTNVTLAELVFGTKISTPVQLLTTPSTPPIQSSLPQHVKQAQQFANQLGQRIKKTFSQVQTSLIASRNKMKKQYDKHAKEHHYQVNDKVMLWHPNKKKGIPRCWQPNLSRPWTINRLIGDLHCQLATSQSTTTPVVHVNQLKYILPRFNHLQTQQISAKITPQQYNTTTDIFEPLCTKQATPNARDECNLIINREEHEETVENRPVNRKELERRVQADEDTSVISRGWCIFNQGNILQQRTRSQSIT